ncbi:hypothetical protein HBN77_21415 [Pseudomonas sp. WS 5018]|nr:hypothetical protein [Pseudomonas sp. WS 5018]
MQHLIHNSLNVYSLLRDELQLVIEKSKKIDPKYASHSGVALYYYSERCQSINLLLQQWKLWDCDILMRAALECATRFLFIRAVAGAECNTVIELKPEHHAASPWHFA